MCIRDSNKLEDRISIECGDLKTAVSIYGRDSFDKITCNPPYMKCGSGNQNDIDTKSISRHEVMCTVDDVINVSAKPVSYTHLGMLSPFSKFKICALLATSKRWSIP